MTARFTRVGPEAAAEVHRLTQRAFAPYGILTPPSGALKETVEVVAAQVAGNLGILGLLDEVAVAAARLEEHGPALHVRRIAVEPAYQGRGIGGALMRWVEGDAAGRGYAEVRLGVRAALTGNRALYEHLGYRLVADHDFWVELGKPLPVP